MSGGSWDYVYSKFEDVADRLSLSSSPLRRAFGKQVQAVSEALHDIEWVDSFDYSTGGDEQAIRRSLGDNADVLVLQEMIGEARSVADKLATAIENATSLAEAKTP